MALETMFIQISQAIPWWLPIAMSLAWVVGWFTNEWDLI